MRRKSKHRAKSFACRVPEDLALGHTTLNFKHGLALQTNQFSLANMANCGFERKITILSNSQNCHMSYVICYVVTSTSYWMKKTDDGMMAWCTIDYHWCMMNFILTVSVKRCWSWQKWKWSWSLPDPLWFTWCNILHWRLLISLSLLTTWIYQDTVCLHPMKSSLYALEVKVPHQGLRTWLSLLPLHAPGPASSDSM